MVPTHYVLIDSSVLLKDPSRSSAATDALARLAGHQQITVCVPRVVEGELRSNLIEKATNELEAIERHISTLKRKLPTHLVGLTTELSGNLVDLRNQLNHEISADLSAWLAALGCEFVEISESHARSAFDAYFAGNPPYRASRERQDIPDALIVEVARDISVRDGTLHFIAADKRLREAAGTLPETQTYDSLQAFISSDVASSLLARTHGTANLARLIEIISSDDYSLATSLNQRHESALEYREIRVPRQYGDTLAFIRSVGTASDIEWEWDESEYYGGGELTVPCVYQVSALIDYIDQYWRWPDGRPSETTREVDVIIEATLRIIVQGDLSSRHLTTEQLEALYAEATITIDAINSASVSDDPHWLAV